MTEGSKLLFTATNKHLYIKSVKILLPNAKDNPKWNEVSQAKQTDETLKHEDAWIKIEEPTNQAGYINQDLNLPFTKIEGPEICGQPGNIQGLPPYLNTNYYGHKMRALRRAWI